MTSTSDRIDRERSFHDERFHDDSARAAAGKFYRAVPTATDDYRRTLLRLGTGGVLEYGCGVGSSAFDLARQADVIGIDISPVAIEKARQHAAEIGVDATFVEMNAESLDFEDGQFDLVCGSGILHHLDINVAMGEIERIVRPGGAAVFLEPLGYNPLINWYRDRTPDMRTEDEHPLKGADLDRLGASAGEALIRYHGFAALASAPFLDRSFGSAMNTTLQMFDRVVLQVPGVKKLAWIAVIELHF